MKKFTLVCFALLATLGTKAMETKSFTLSHEELNHISNGKFVYSIDGVGTFTITGNGNISYGKKGYWGWLGGGSSYGITIPQGNVTLTWTPEQNRRIIVKNFNFTGGADGTYSTAYTTIANGEKKTMACDAYGYADDYWAYSGDIEESESVSASITGAAVNVKAITINYELYTGLGLDETKSYDVNLNGPFDFVTLNRSLKTTWSTFCLPISLTSEQITAMFGSGAEVAKLTGTTGTELQFSTDFRSIEANEPCLIKLAEAGSTFTLNDSVMVNPVGNTPQFTRGAATLVGNYATQYVPEGSYFISANMFYQAGFETTNIKGFRAYITFDEGTAAAPAKSLMVAVDNNTTAIDGINADDATNASGDIYTLGGQLVRKNAASTEGLAKGIYLVNGKKVLVK